MTQPAAHDDASGYIREPEYRADDGFTEITEIHRSERNVVYRARRFGRFWVLKTVADAGSAALTAALRKEFEVAVMLPRSCAAGVYSLEKVDGVGLCIVMDYLEGPTLREWLKEDHSQRERRQMARRIAEAVLCVHQAGVVHRDVKPENIIVTSLGATPMLIDFGLADTASHAEFKAPAGTRRYISPEQLAEGSPDIRNDIYSLGCVLRELRPGPGWRSAIRRCLRPIDRRPPDAECLLRMVDRHRSFRRAILFAAAVAAVAAATVLAPRSSAPDETLRQRAEALDRSLDSLTTASNRRIASLNGSLDSISDSLRTAARTHAARSAALARTIREGERRIDRVWRATGLLYLDTADPSGFVANIYSSAPMDAEAQRYVASQPDLSPQERAQLTDALNRRIKTNIDLWIKRRNRMP